MFRRSLTAGLFSVLALMFTFVGCSDDSNPNNANIGDPNSPTFQPMKAAISAAVDSTLATALNYAWKPNRYPSEVGWDRPQLGPNDSLLYNYVGDWHVLYLGLSASFDYNYAFVDSARFWEGDRAVKFFREDRVTSYDLIRHQSSVYNGTSDEYTDQVSYFDFGFEEVGQPTRYFTGHARVILDDYFMENNEQQNINYDFEVTADNVNYFLNHPNDWNTSYITGGELTIDVTVDDGTNSLEWSISVDFNSNGEAQIAATDGEKTYSYMMTPSYE